MQVAIVPARIGGSLEIHVAAVIGNNHAVLLHGFEDHLIGWAVAGNVEARLEPEPHSHDVAGAGTGSRRVRGRSHKVTAIQVALGVIHRHANRMIDNSRGHFVVAHQPWEYGQACRVH